MLRAALALSSLAVLAVVSASQDDGMVHVVLETELGEIELAVDVESAPITSANFLRYVDAGHYDGGQFHRTVTPENQPNDSVKIEVIQASVNEERRDAGFGPIPLERTTLTGLRHVDGAVSMARGEPDSASSSFFLCIGDQPELDYGGARNPDGQGFAAFGRVIGGQDVVRRIQRAPHVEQRLEPPVRLLAVRRK